MKNQDLNGCAGVVLPPEDAKSAPVEGCVKVRLDMNGREVAVKHQNLRTTSATQGTQEERLQHVLAQIQNEG